MLYKDEVIWLKIKKFKYIEISWGRDTGTDFYWYYIKGSGFDMTFWSLRVVIEF